ncbi:MAG: hypothetical protein ACP5GJ_00980 [Nanopusillaceae archaeon]|jgi:hypothetical protein
MEKWFWIIISIIVFSLSLLLYFKFTNINYQTEEIYTEISECQNLFNTIQQVCYSNNGTTIYLNFKVNKYLNYVSSNGNTVTCYIYNTYYNYSFPCLVYINTTNNLIQYYTSGIYYTSFYGKNYEVLPLIIEKNSPNSIIISLGELNYQQTYSIKGIIYLYPNNSLITLQSGGSTSIYITAQENLPQNTPYNISFSCISPNGIACSLNQTSCITFSSCTISSTISIPNSINAGIYNIVINAKDNEGNSRETIQDELI